MRPEQVRAALLRLWADELTAAVRILEYRLGHADGYADGLATEPLEAAS